jgi:hypothetical protein
MFCSPRLPPLPKQPRQVLRHRLAVLIRLRALAQHGREFPGYFGIALKIRPN